MRTPSPVLYGSDYVFEFGRGQIVKQSDNDAAIVITSGRQVHEALATAAECAKNGVNLRVVDMPSIDESLLLEQFDSGKPMFIAEQNNGYIWQNLLKVLYRHRANAGGQDRIHTINTLTAEGKPQFIHSATYEELVEVYGLSPAKLARTIQERL
jgi:transketolase C-terminal domain/subunit